MYACKEKTVTEMGSKKSGADSQDNISKIYEREGESDDDCEVYFLKPVNEYNIVDRIKEANKELFAGETNKNADKDNELDTADDANNPNRKVTFALKLEDYAPENTAENSNPEAENYNGANEVNESQHKMNVVIQCTVITEETKLEAVNEVETQKNVLVTLAQQQLDDEQPTVMHVPKDNDGVLEEICEEIMVMDMDEKLATTLQTRRMLKQNTFDCADELPVVEDVQEESDNKSMSNLITSDIEDESERAQEQVETVDDEYDVDDDQLSIIVASYLPNDYEHNYSYSSDADSGSVRLQPNNAAAASNRKVTKSRRTLPFGRRFSLHRKAAGKSNSIGSCNSTRHQLPAPPPEVTDLKLNYKICCEYRHASLEHLPKYTGYLSEYGLSREQHAQREEHLKRKQRFVLEQTLKVSEQQMHKMQDNDRAFTSWLRNKMRYPSNKTRNMFDVKVGNNGNGSSSIGVAKNRNNVCGGKSKN